MLLPLGAAGGKPLVTPRHFVVEEQQEKAHDRRAGKQQQRQDQSRAERQMRKLKEAREKQQRDQHPRQHGKKHGDPQLCKGLGNVVQRHKADRRHDPNGNGVQLGIGQSKDLRKYSRDGHKDDIRQTAGHGAPYHVAQEAPLDPCVIRLKREEEGRHADGQRTDERELDRLQRIGHINEEQQQRHHEGEDVLDQEQRRGTLDVVDNAATLRNDVWHGTELRIEQDDLRDLCRCLAARRHRNAAVGILQRQNVIHAVAGHGDRVPLRLQCADQATLLIRCDASENGVFLHRLGKVTVGDERGGVYIALGVLNARVTCDLADGNGVIAGDDADGHTLRRKVTERVTGIGAEQVVQEDQRDRGDVRRVERRLRLAVVGSQQQHAAAPLRPRLGIAPHGVVAVAQHEFRCADDISAVLAEVGSRPLGRGGEGNALDGVPRALLGELLRHCLCRLVVRLLAAIERGENLLDRLIIEALRVKRENVGNLHFRLGDGACFVHA